MRIKAQKTFFSSELKTFLTNGDVAEVSPKYGNDLIKGGLAKEATKKKVTVEAAPKKEASTMTQSKSLKKGASKKK